MATQQAKLTDAEKIVKLRRALTGLVGAESREELQAMEDMLQIMSVPDADKTITINAIHAILETE